VRVCVCACVRVLYITLSIYVFLYFVHTIKCIVIVALYFLLLCTVGL
jgi:hypothetical protein